MAHPRRHSAHWPEPPTASGTAVARPSFLPSPANQLTFQADPRPSLPLKQGPRLAPCLVSISGYTRGRPAGLPFCTQAMGALIGNRLAGVLGLRPLAPLPVMAVSDQHNFSDPLGFARPFHPSSPCQRLRLRAEGIGGWTSFDLFFGVLGNGVPELLQATARLTGRSYRSGRFPRSNDRQDSTFPRESSERAAFAIFPPFFRVSGTLQRALACGSTSFITRIRSKYPTT